MQIMLLLLLLCGLEEAILRAIVGMMLMMMVEEEEMLLAGICKIEFIGELIGTFGNREANVPIIFKN
jgi:hypothetical protein